jgi:hypothetical protein
MTADLRACASRPLIESAHDGRLDRHDLAAVERHLAVCSACAAWAAELERLRAEVRRDPWPSPSALELARARLALLRRAASDDGGERRPTAFVVAALAIVAALAVIAWPRPHASRAEIAPLGAAIPLAAKVTFTTSAASDFKVRRDPRSFDLDLYDGTVALWVRKLGTAQRVLVRTGDASVEVRGTVFRVTAERGRLAGVHVDGGVVEVRRGDEVRLLHAGEDLDLREPRVDENDTIEDRPGSSDSRDHRATAARAQVKTAPAPPTPPPATRSVADGPRDPVADDFARAVKNLDYADYPRAADDLSSFVQKHPDDARAEDAAFLAVVALQKTGRRAEMVAAARDYLRRFPHGARAAEVQRWAEPSEPPR